MTRASLTCWFISLDQAIGQNRLPNEEQLLACLSSQEHEKYSNYSHQDAKHTNLLSRGMLRHALSRHGNLLPKEWIFSKGQHGKPCLINEQFVDESLVFNVSHSGAWLCIAVLSGVQVKAELGVDIERFRSKVATDNLVKRFFAAEEIRQLQLMDEPQRQERFFDLWALKESYIKATGQGLTCSLSSFAFNIQLLPDIQPILSQMLPSDGYVGKADAFVPIALSGDHTNNFCSRLGRLTPEYRVAITLPKTYQTLPIICRLW